MKYFKKSDNIEDLWIWTNGNYWEEWEIMVYETGISIHCHTEDRGGSLEVEELPYILFEALEIYKGLAGETYNLRKLWSEN